MRRRAAYYRLHRKKFRYLLVGFWNTVFSYLLFAAFFAWLGDRLHYQLIVVAVNVIAITNNYIAYKVFVFRTRGNYWREYLRFYAVYGLGIGLNLLLLPLLLSFTPLNAYAAQAVVTVIIIIVGYIGHNRFSFRR
ncbi:MAG: GtrA family protein [Negativicutes bacterium]|nr:GtrA family protein [Negativicutes bacterium]